MRGDNNLCPWDTAVFAATQTSQGCRKHKHDADKLRQTTPPHPSAL